MDDLFFDKVRFPDEILKAAEEYTLRDLLESPTHQAWVVSALANAGRFVASYDGHNTAEDEYLQFRLRKLYFSMAKEDVTSCFRSTSALIRANKKLNEIAFK